jgi:hypothetical protein
MTRVFRWLAALLLADTHLKATPDALLDGPSRDFPEARFK